MSGGGEEVLTVPGSRSVASGKAQMWLRSRRWVFGGAEPEEQNRQDGLEMSS